MKPRLAFVDHSFHVHTRSGDFLRRLFSDRYEVVDLWDTSWDNGPAVTAKQINDTSCSVVFFFQSLLTLTELRRIQSKIVWAPMFDSVPLHNSAYWLELSTIPLKIITFSSTLHQRLAHYGLDSLPVQYWFDPATLPKVGSYSGMRVFFWQRTDITFDQVKRLLGNLPIEQCIIKLNPDPHYKANLPSPSDVSRYHITVLDKGFTDKADYLHLLQSCNVFICPRRYEGIGMSFLEAMAIGLVPVALNHPTMNEYIHHNDNGILFDDFQPIALSNLPELGQRVQQSALVGFAQWQAKQTEIMRFIDAPAQAIRQLTFTLKTKILVLQFFYLAYLVLRRLQLLR